jgi:hypothetical protein
MRKYFPKLFAQRWSYIGARIAHLVWLWYMACTAKVLGFGSQQGQEIFLFPMASRPDLELIQPPIKWVPGAVPLGVERSGCEAYDSPPLSAEVKSGGTVLPLAHISLWCSAY